MPRNYHRHGEIQRFCSKAFDTRTVQEIVLLPIAFAVLAHYPFNEVPDVQDLSMS